MDLYTLNKNIVEQLPNLNQKETEMLKTEIHQWRNKNYFNNGYFMLLNRDINYYTLFRWQNRNDECLPDLVVECLEKIGKLKTWEVQEDKIELWVETPMPRKGCIAVYLFPYDNFIVYFGG